LAEDRAGKLWPMRQAHIPILGMDGLEFSPRFVICFDSLRIFEERFSNTLS
jgi:hypothetical protein